MDIRNRKDLRRGSADAVAANPGDVRLTLLIYLAVTAFSGLFVAALTTVLDQRIANTGGLQNLGTQAILSTIQTAAPLILSLALMGLDLGRRAVSLKMARRQSVEPRDLLLGYVIDAGFADTGVAKYALLQPAADIDTLEQVFILTEYNAG